MRATLALTTWLTLLAGCATAAPAPAPTLPPTVTQASASDEIAPQALNLWQVRAPNGAISHLLGTYHFGIALEEALPEAHIETLDHARLVIAEMDLVHADMSGVAAVMMLPPGDDLEAILGPDLWAALVARITSTPEATLHRLTPFTAMILVMGEEAGRQQAQRAAARRVGNGTSSGEPTTTPDMLDLAVLRRADERSIPIAGLETMEQQLALLQAVPLPEILRDLRSSLRPSTGHGGGVARTSQAFVDGDLEALWSEIQTAAAHAPSLYETILFSRNAVWLAPLITELDRGRAFVAVGVGHLLGDRGLLAMLQARGYTITRVRR